MVAFHYASIAFCNTDFKEINKVISSVLQIFGGLLVLYSIDSNLGVIDKNSIINMLIKWIKSFPPLAKPKTTEVGVAIEASASPSIKARSGKPGTTTEERLAYLQRQISWLKEDQDESFTQFKKKLSEIESKNVSEISSIRSSIGLTNDKLTDISVGGIKLQMFGVFFVIYGSVVSYFT